MLYHITCYASKNEKLVFASFERKEDHVIGLKRVWWGMRICDG
jgi:hypothetical protein